MLIHCSASPVVPGLLSAPGPAPEPAAEFPAAQDAHSVQGVGARTDHCHWYCFSLGLGGVAVRQRLVCTSRL